jgi:hypothetical protein
MLPSFSQNTTVRLGFLDKSIGLCQSGGENDRIEEKGLSNEWNERLVDHNDIHDVWPSIHELDQSIVPRY